MPERKTVDEWVVQQRTEQGWEDVFTAETSKEGTQTLKDYRENQPQYPARLVKRRVKKDGSQPI